MKKNFSEKSHILWLRNRLKTEWLKTWIKLQRDDLKCVNFNFVWPNLDYSTSNNNSHKFILASQQNANKKLFTQNKWITHKKKIQKKTIENYKTIQYSKWNNEVEYYTKIKTRNETLIWLFLMCGREALGRKNLQRSARVERFNANV